MISEKAAVLINELWGKMHEHGMAFSARYFYTKPIEEYISVLEAEVEELQDKMAGIDPKERLPEIGLDVLIQTKKGFNKASLGTKTSGVLKEYRGVMMFHAAGCAFYLLADVLRWWPLPDSREEECPDD